MDHSYENFEVNNSDRNTESEDTAHEVSEGSKDSIETLPWLRTISYFG